MKRTVHRPAGHSPPMVAIRVQKCYGAVTVHYRVTAPSIERTLEIAGEGARVVCPVNGEVFFASPAKANVETTENPSSEAAPQKWRGLGR